MIHNIIIAMRDVIHMLSMYIVLEGHLLVQILVILTQLDTIRAGKFLISF